MVSYRFDDFWMTVSDQAGHLPRCPIENLSSISRVDTAARGSSDYVGRVGCSGAEEEEMFCRGFE